MVKAASQAEVVQVGSRVKVVFHGYFEGVPLEDRYGYEIGTEHTVTEIGVDGSGYFLNNSTWVLPEEIEVI